MDLGIFDYGSFNGSKLKPPLNEYVHHISFNQFEYFGSGEYVSVVPDGMTELVISLGSPYIRRKSNGSNEQTVKSSHLIGLKTRSCELRLNPSIKAISVRFLPGAIAHFTRENISLFNDTVANAELIFGKSIFELEERLFEAKNIRFKVQLIQEFLIGKIESRRHSGLINDVIQKTYFHPFLNSITPYISSISEYKKLERIFKQDLGVTPKKLMQIIRFNYSTKLLFEDLKSGFTQIALQSGYFDQAHFNKSIKEFSGYTPREYINVSNKMFTVNQELINKMF